MAAGADFLAAGAAVEGLAGDRIFQKSLKCDII